MKKRTIAWIILGVVMAHMGFFYFFGQLNALPKTKFIPPPNFGYKEETFQDPKTGERTIWREIRVTTRLTDRSKLPPPATPKTQTN